MTCVDTPIEHGNSSCLTVTLSRIGDGLDVLSKGLSAQVSVINDRISAKIDTIGTGLKARCSIVCTLDEVRDFLKVTPADIQWITDDMGVFFDVESNVEWIIVTS